MKRKRIFVSSVQRELKVERTALRDYVHDDPLLSHFFDVFLFEGLPASGRRPDEVYLKEVAACDVYLGIFGHEYGAEKTAGLSPTEREFLRATELGKPRLIYVKGTDDKTRHPKMRALIERAGSELIRRRFDDTASLLPAVYASLVAWLEEHRLLLNGPFDAAPCAKATLRDLDTARMKDFIRDARASRGFPIRETATASQLLTHLNLLDDGRPTHAAVLVFGRTPQQFLPSSEIKCAHFHGVDVAKPIPSYQVYKGTVFALVDQAVDFVMSRLALSVGTRAVTHAGGAKAPVAYEIPREVVAEGIVNAVAHRDYGNNGSVQVMLFSDRLEIWNPGSLPDSLPVARLREPHGSIPHNPLIAEPMYLTQYIERLGTGVGDMIRRCREAGLREPSYKVTDGIRLTIWRDGRYSAANSSGKRPVESSGKRPGNTLGEMGLLIVASIQEQPDITIVEIAQRLGRTARGVEKQIRLLREAEIIGRVGPAKGGHWEVLHRTENNGIELGEKLGGKLGEKLGKTRAAIVAAMKDDPKVTVIELAKLLGLSTTAIEKNIAFLKSHELVQRHGPAKGGHWEVLQ